MSEKTEKGNVEEAPLEGLDLVLSGMFHEVAGESVESYLEEHPDAQLPDDAHERLAKRYDDMLRAGCDFRVVTDFLDDMQTHFMWVSMDWVEELDEAKAKE